MEHYQEVMVSLSEYIMKIRRKRPLAKKSRWRHIRLAKKSRYLENHASQTKRYKGSLSWSLDRSVIFVFVYKKTANIISKNLSV